MYIDGRFLQRLSHLWSVPTTLPTEVLAPDTSWFGFITFDTSLSTAGQLFRRSNAQVVGEEKRLFSNPSKAQSKNILASYASRLRSWTAFAKSLTPRRLLWRSLIRSCELIEELIDVGIWKLQGHGSGWWSAMVWESTGSAAAQYNRFSLGTTAVDTGLRMGYKRSVACLGAQSHEWCWPCAAPAHLIP
jgi:hypothetical protein